MSTFADPPRPRPGTLPRLIRRRSRLLAAAHLPGFGVYTTVPLTQHSLIARYEGEVISTAVARRREPRYSRLGCLWTFELTRDWSVDAAVGGNIARYINHACRPNCYALVYGRGRRAEVWFRAAKAIPAGAELTFDYMTGGTMGLPCACRPGCLTIL